MQIRQSASENNTLFTLTQTCRYLNCCCNFFLYSATSSLFRRQLREIFKCSLSKPTTTKEQANLQTIAITRTRTASSPPVLSTQIDNASLERKNLLVTSASSRILTTPVENANVPLVPSEPTNGHVVTFKT